MEVALAAIGLDIGAQGQGLCDGQVVGVANAADGLLHAIDQQAQLLAVAVHHGGDVMPRAHRHQAGGRLQALFACGIGDTEVDAAIGVEPQRIGAPTGGLPRALVDDRRPGVGEAVDLDPGLERQGLVDVECRIRRRLGDLQPIEVQRRAQLAADPGRVDAIVAGQGDRHRLVADALHAQAVVHGAAAAVAPALDQQRVGARVGHRLGLHVVVGHVVRAPDGAAERVEQSPVRVAAGDRCDVEIQTLARRGGELVGHRLVGRDQLAADIGVQRQGLGRAQVDQAEAVVAGGVGGAIDPQRVVAGHQVEDAGAVGRIAALHRAVRDLSATRPGQVPAHPRVVGQRVEVQARVLAEREVVEILLAEGDGAGHHAGRVLPRMAE